MDAEKIIENFRKEASYKIGFVEGAVHVLFQLNNSIRSALRTNRKFENGGFVAESGPEFVEPGCPEILKDIFKDHPPIELNIDIQEEINNSDFMKQLIERLKNEKSPD